MTQLELNKKLVLAAIHGELEWAKEAIKMGAGIHWEHDRALRSAMYNGHLDVIKLLVKNGADIHVYDNDDLKIVIEQGPIEMAQFLKLCKREDKMAKNLVKIMLSVV